ncbi:MAG: tRNA 2-thiouridine(34) synthase MnmA [Dehalococcoidia bacterium]|nr:tRNA 2-thiouridine(34) synthase MnmA [Dehalococcoidia bacterium]
MEITGNRKQRVVVAMSGGVDSSVTAALLARRGCEVIGVTMRLFNAPDETAGRLSKSCCSVQDVEDARAVCRAIGAQHYYLNFEKEFRKHVIDYFISEYERGRTPYPCLACNDRLKFRFLMERSELMDADFVATGHYARIVHEEGRHRLKRAADPSKDQSYVLYGLSQSQMARLMMPVGEFAKAQVRATAREMGLPTADKPDSQDICFIPDGDYREFLGSRLSVTTPGDIVDSAGRVLGSHEGVHMFTIGQRKGIPLQGGTGRAIFVTGVDMESGNVTVGPADELQQSELFASEVNWIAGAIPSSPVEVTARIRYRGAEDRATVTPFAGPGGNWAKVRFERPQRAVTPGQAVVFYDGEEVLGGGFIELKSPVVAPSQGAALTIPSPAGKG